MISTAAEAIGTRQQTHSVRRHVTLAPALDKARQFARWRILRSFRVHTNRGAVDDAVAAFVATDDVVVEHGFDADLLLHRPLPVQTRAEEALLFADVTHENERRLEIDPALADQARQLHRQCHTAP